MKRLPPLIKDPTKEYWVSCSVSNELESQFFTYVISFYQGSSIMIVDQGTLINNTNISGNDVYKEYVECLGDFYNTKPMVCIDSLKPKNNQLIGGRSVGRQHEYNLTHRVFFDKSIKTCLI